MWFALPFGAGCALCQYLLPEGFRLWAAAGALLLGLASLPLRGKARRAARIAAAGCAAPLHDQIFRNVLLGLVMIFS